MSTLDCGRWIVCGGEGCEAKALATVALQFLLQADMEALVSTKGWLFVHEDAETSHYCPRCAPQYLRSLEDE